MTGRAVTLGVDPGNNMGVAWGLESEVCACYLAAPGDTLIVPAVVDACRDSGHAVFELPKFYPLKAYGSPKKAYNVGNALIREAVTLGEMKQCARQRGMTLEEVLPRTWKGTLKKDAMLRLIWERLSVRERELVKALGLPKTLIHNVLDAIGIVLWSVGRLDMRSFQ